jgi:hypothetical protein
MKCLECRGACCEVINVKDVTPIDEFPAATSQWLKARSIGQAEDGAWILESRCKELSHEGLCRLHDTDEKPIACCVAPAGGHDCLEAVSIRRTRAEYERIREDHDPEVEELWDH